MTTGEGGMVLTSDENLYQQGKKLKNQGVEEMYEYWHNLVGYNYRMTNICAAIGCAQMERVDRFISRKKEIAKLYYDYLKDLPVKPHNKSPNVVHTYWMVSILVRDKIERNRMAQFLAGHGVETRPTFCPIPDMPMYKNNENYPVAEMIGACGMNLPSWPGLMDRDVKEICDMIHDFYLKE
jgi:perosamine synthetase